MAGKLTARQAATLKQPGKYGDGRGLWLRVRPDGRRGWVFRYRFRGRDREMGLGSADEVSLREAREQAVSARQLLREGRDPIEECRKKQVAARGVPSFAGCAEAFLAANETAWRNPKHRQQWQNTLVAYVFPVFGDSPVDSISVDDVLRVVQPLWQAKPETASRIRGRVERILDWGPRAWAARRRESSALAGAPRSAFAFPLQGAARAALRGVAMARHPGIHGEFASASRHCSRGAGIRDFDRRSLGRGAKRLLGRDCQRCVDDSSGADKGPARAQGSALASGAGNSR